MKRVYRLTAVHNGKTEQFVLDNKKTLKIKAKANTRYQLKDKDDTLIDDVRLETVGDDVYVYLPQENNPILFLEDYKNYVEINDSNTLIANHSTLMLTQEIGTVSTANTHSGILALAGLGVIGAGVALTNKNKDNANNLSYNNTSDNTSSNVNNTSSNANNTSNNTSTPEPKPTIKINPITDDNIINIEESQSALEITGTVSNFKDGDALTLKIGTTSQTVTVTNGKFTLKLDGAALVAHKEIVAEITRDGQIINNETHIYSVDTQIDTPTIAFNPIAGDNIIDATEAKGTITVSGSVTNAKDGDEIIVSCGCPTCSGINWIDIKTTVTGGKFSVDFEGSDMVANNGNNIIKATVTASDDAKNTATATAEQDYDVVNSNPKTDNQAQIYLDDVKLDLAKEIGSVRLSGKLDFANSDSMYKWGYNKDFVRSIALKIGDKEFMVGIDQDDYSFYLDLTHQEYQTLKEKDISYELFAHNVIYADWLPTFDYKSEGKEKWVDVPANWTDVAKAELNKVKVTFDNQNIQNAKTLEFDIDTTTQISGKVVNAKANDNIIININGKEHKTTVNNDLTFGIQVENSELNNLKNIQATLNTTNDKGEAISVSDVGYILQNIQVADNFVNLHELIPLDKRVIQHTDPNYNFPYFIHANIPGGEYYGGYLSKLPFAGVGEPVTIKYYFVTQEDYDSGKYQPTHLDKSTWSAYSEQHKEVARDVYQQISNATNIRFVETLDETEKDTFLMRGNHLYGGAAGTAGFGSGIAVNVYDDPKDGFYKQVLIHEILHTLGGAHVADTFNILDYAKYETINGLSNLALGKDGTLRIFDLAYLHYRFGVNPNHNAGDDVYRFQTYTDKTPEAGIYIWDGGGVDTFDASQEKEGVTVNLTPGSWIYRGEKSDSFVVKDKVKINDFNEVNKFFPEFPDTKFIGNVNFTHEQIIYNEGQAFIGYGTQIENAIGSNYDDTLKGNKADNNIFGGDGNDTIDGDDGHDYLDGGKGIDTLTGGQGNDIFVVDNDNDVIVELIDTGVDTVYSQTLNYTLPQYVENISLFGIAENATGNELNNVMTGNDLNNTLNGGLGDDTLNGGRGSDVLIGGAGADAFVFSDLLDGSIDSITDFNITEDTIALSLKIFDNLTTTNLKNHIKYDENTGHLSYDMDANGHQSPIHFATLTVGLDENVINYKII